MKKLFIDIDDRQGFTMTELVVVIAIVCVLASIAIKSYMDSRMHMMDAAALAEARGLGKSVINVFLDGGDVDLTHNPGDGPQIGALDTGGNSRKPVFHMSDEMEALIFGSSDFGGTGKGSCEAWVSHPLGSRTYYLLIDEENEITSFPNS